MLLIISNRLYVTCWLTLALYCWDVAHFIIPSKAMQDNNAMPYKQFYQSFTLPMAMAMAMVIVTPAVTVVLTRSIHNCSFPLLTRVSVSPMTKKPNSSVPLCKATAP